MKTKFHLSKAKSRTTSFGCVILKPTGTHFPKTGRRRSPSFLLFCANSYFFTAFFFMSLVLHIPPFLLPLPLVRQALSTLLGKQMKGKIISLHVVLLRVRRFLLSGCG